MSKTETSRSPSGVLPIGAELQQARQWRVQHLAPRSKSLPFSFVYSGQSADEFLTTWPFKTETKELSEHRRQETLTWTDPKTTLEVRCVLVQYEDFPVIEWTVYLRNRASADSPVLENLQAIDTRLEAVQDADYMLHYWNGDSNTPESYQPFNKVLTAGASQRFTPAGGRPTNGAFPYYNLQGPDGGLMLAVGWPGQWASSFVRDSGNGLQMVAGQEQTHLILKSGEEIRTPLIAVLFWQGPDIIRAHNLWRRWMMAHNVPRPNGQPPAPIFAFCSGGFFDGLKVSEASEKLFVDALIKQGIQLDYWWMDAGWYPCDSWPQIGTWEPDSQRFPQGIKAVSDYMHTKGLKLIVWFEPERVEPGSWLAKNHPEWLLGGKLLNLGNPDARQWLTDHVDRLLREQGIDAYRQDFNMDPLTYWRQNDAPDRQGLTENLHVQGYLAYWDELQRRHPNMLIDSCASGGRRNDLETLRRALPLLRSDYQSFQGDPQFALGNQGHTYGLSFWVPYYGQGVYYNPDQYVYSVRSYLTPAFGMAVDVRKEGIDWGLYRRLAQQWRQVAPYMLCDYYPLTSYSLANNQWLAWQFNRPEKNDGLVQAFRHANNLEATKTLLLFGLEASAQYEITDLDAAQPQKMSGREIMEHGLSVTIKTNPGAALITYRKAP